MISTPWSSASREKYLILGVERLHNKVKDQCKVALKIEKDVASA